MAGWNGNGVFSRTYNWTDDKTNGIKITSVRHDANDIDFVNGINNCLTKDGQSSPTANIAFGGRKITGYGTTSAASARSDVPSFGQVQDGKLGWVDGGGSADGITAAYSPAVASADVTDGRMFFVRATAANTSATPTFKPDAATARTIVKNGGQTLVAGNIAGDGHELILRYNSASTRYELMNPATVEVGLSTGDIKLTIKTTADTGWILMNDGTVGNAASSATTRANADTEDLYTLLWNNVSDTYAPVSTGRGANAASDFAANKTITLTRTLGRALGVSGSGSSLTARALGEYLGEETHTLTEAELAAHDHTASFAGTAHSHTYPAITNAAPSTSDRTMIDSSGGGTYTSSSVTAGGTVTVNNAGGGEPHENMQPTVFLNVMIKL